VLAPSPCVWAAQFPLSKRVWIPRRLPEAFSPQPRGVERGLALTTQLTVCDLDVLSPVGAT